MSKLKGVERTVRRIGEMVELDEQQRLIVEHMLESVVKNRDQRIEYLETKAAPRNYAPTKQRITGALRSTINAHGPITPENIESASKRILGQISEKVEDDEDVSR